MSPILLFGATGQLGRALRDRLAALGPIQALTRTDCDLRESDALRARILAAKPRAIVNAAAMTAVDLAENDPETAYAVNARAPAVMAEAAVSTGALLLHISSDYVFDGAQTRAYRETDPAAPRSVYGRSKLAGDQAIGASGCRHLILRSGWLYSASGHNFLTTILHRLANTPDTTLTIVADTYGSPTSHKRLAQAACHALAQRLAAPNGPIGCYHVAAHGRCSWYEYAREAVSQAEALGLLPTGAATRLRAIRASDWPAPAARPAQSQLDSQRFEHDFGMTLPDWREDLRQILEQIAEHLPWTNTR